MQSVEAVSVLARTVGFMALTIPEREQFLSEPHIAARSVEAEGGRAPLTIPIWYQYTPGEKPWVLTGTGSRKLGLIRAAGRFTLMVDRVEPTLRLSLIHI